MYKRNNWLKVPAWLGCSPGKQILDAASQQIVAERSEEVVKPVLIIRTIAFGLSFHIDSPKPSLSNISEDAQCYQAAERHPGQRTLEPAGAESDDEHVDDDERNA